MAKLTRDQKVEIYQKYVNGESIIFLAKTYKIRRENLNYLVRLIDMHGLGILRNGFNKYYSKESKEEAINKVLIDGQSLNSTALEYGLSSDGMLYNWIKSYKENNYVIVEKTRGRPPTMTIKKQDKKYEEMNDKEKIKFLESKTEYLEAEIEYRKKLKAVVQARKQREQKKK